MGALLLLLALSLNQMFLTQNSSSLLEGSQIVTSDLLEGSQIVDDRKLLEAENVFSSCSVVTELFFPCSFSLFACFFPCVPFFKFCVGSLVGEQGNVWLTIFCMSMPG